MKAYLLSSIQTAAYGNLFDCSTRGADGRDVMFSSMSHENVVGVMDEGGELLFTSLLNTDGLKSRFSELAAEEGLVLRIRRMTLRTIWRCWASFSMPPRR